MSHVLEVSARTSPGQKGVIRSARAAGEIPAILYGCGEANAPLHVSHKSVLSALQTKGFKSRVYTLVGKSKEVKGLDGAKVLVRDIQFHPVKDTPLHLDFLRVKDGQKVNVSIPLRYTDEEKSPGLKRGGILNVVVPHLDALVDVSHIPESIEISLAGYQMGQSVHLKDLKISEHMRVLHLTPEQTLATVVAPSGVSADKAEEGAEDSAS